MMSRLSKAMILGLFTGAVGLALGLGPFGFDLEENAGLDLLFNLRGAREPPPDIVVVTIDKESVDHLNLPDNPRKWPRSYHARLTENLANQGVVVLAYDLNFTDPKSTEEDHLFSKAISRAGNVVLCESLKREKAPLTSKGRLQPGVLEIERIEPPIPPLANGAVALAPFPLPKVPVKVTQYWTFKTEAGDTPTLPVVVFQVFTLKVYDKFVSLLEKVSSSRISHLPRDKDSIITSRSIEHFIREIRNIFEGDPHLAEKMLKELESSGYLPADPKETQMLKSLIKMYQAPNSLYLNFYGPPGTITTIPYDKALQPLEAAHSEKKQLDLRGKVVFVGLSERSESEERDDFHTVFSQPSGLDISGVEIAATAFANLLEDRPVHPVSLWGHLAILLLWGFGMGVLCYLFSTFVGAMSAIGLSFLYLFAAYLQFRHNGSWYPLVFTLLAQSPLAFFGAVLWKSIETNRERQNIRKALRYYVPERAIEELVKNVGDFRARKQLVYGICLDTDAEQYTSLAETMEPQELSNFLNQYYEALFKPIKEHRGIVSDIVGDSMMAIWVTEKPDLAFRNKACQAALDISRTVDRFNQSSEKLKLPTRIGLHSGYLMLGNVGAIDHYEYHPIGDIVNTASRIEGLNKYLGTRILVSEEVIDHLEDFLTRDLGKFLLVGKSKPISIHELISRKEESNELQKNQCRVFAQVLEAFRNRSWEEAMEKCRESIRSFGKDGPSLFYLKLCEEYRESPPEALWDGVIRTTGK